MPSWALGKDICKGAPAVNGKVEAPLGAAHDGAAGVQQLLFRW